MCYFFDVNRMIAINANPAINAVDGLFLDAWINRSEDY